MCDLDIDFVNKHIEALKAYILVREKYFKDITNACKKRTHNFHMAEDAAEKVFDDLLRKDLAPDTNLEDLLFVMARNKAVDEVRIGVRKLKGLKGFSNLHELVELQDCRYDNKEYSKRLKYLREFEKSLSKEDLLLFVLRFVLEWELKDISLYLYGDVSTNLSSNNIRRVMNLADKYMAKAGLNWKRSQS